MSPRCGQALHAWGLALLLSLVAGCAAAPTPPSSSIDDPLLWDGTQRCRRC